eukprot:2592048-Rhodomonas_salina.5
MMSEPQIMFAATSSGRIGRSIATSCTSISLQRGWHSASVAPGKTFSDGAVIVFDFADQNSLLKRAEGS